MPEPTLIQVFGENATQNSTDIIIKKADLVSTGLTPATSNNAEALLVALVLKAADYLNDATQTLDPDVQITITENEFQTLVTRNNATYRQVTYSVDLQTPDTVFTIDPDNY